MRRYIPILLALLLLTGCEGEPASAVIPAPTPTMAPEETTPPACGIAVDVGDGEHIFWVELVPREGGYGDIWVNIYPEGGDGEPLQRFEDNVVSFRTVHLTAEDVDFDGKTDFHFVRDYGSLHGQWTNYYIWDPAEERFIPDPYGLNDLPASDFDEEKKVITAYWHYDVIGGKLEYYRYIDGKLTCVRCLEIGSMAEDGSRPLTVWDLRDGELTEVWRVTDPQGDRSDTLYQKALSRWEDLDYPARQEVRADDTHTFWVEAVDMGEPVADCGKLSVNIYREREDKEPVQSFESWWAEPGLLCFSVEDMDFDGDMDFSVCKQEYRSFHWQSYYVWDAEGEKFVEDPHGLDHLGGAEFDPENKTVRTAHWNAISGGIEYYRYEGTNLICVRTLSWSPQGERMALLVEDGWDGELTVVYDHAAAMDELAEGKVGTEEFLRWEDISYRGE